MRFLLATLLTAALCFLAGLYTPWWSLAIVAFAVALFIKQSIGLAWLSGFVGVFLLWGGLAALLQVKNKGVLSHKIATLLPLQGNTYLLLLITALVGALVAGFAAMSGSSLRPTVRRSVKEAAK